MHRRGQEDKNNNIIMKQLLHTKRILFLIAGLITFTTTLVNAQIASFIENDSLLVMEAENYNDLGAASNGNNWVKALFTDASSGSAIIAPSGSSYTSSIASTSPNASYNIKVTHTGSYYVWARVYAFSSGGDSYHLGLDGSVIIEKIDLYNSTNTYDEFTWLHDSQTITISDTSVHSLEIYCREPELIIDKLILSQNSEYSPTDEGPDETLNPADTISDEPDTNDTTTTDTTTTTAINTTTENNTDMNLSIYPNPAQSTIQVSYNLYRAGTVYLRMINSNGQSMNQLLEVYQQSGLNNISIDLEDFSATDLSNGLYFILLQTGNNVSVQKILINR